MENKADRLVILPADSSHPGAVGTGFYIFQNGEFVLVSEGEVIEERECCIYVNGQELLTMAATPIGLDDLAIGFLANEGLIQGVDEIVELAIKREGSCVDVWLDKTFVPPTRKILTSGCTGGATFTELVARLEPLDFSIAVSLEELQEGLKALYAAGELYRITRGVHTSILWREGNTIARAEDVGRHNTLDKLRGYCLKQGINTHGSVLFSTGRISTEMLNKAVRMGCPVVVSRTSATSLSVELARGWNVTLIGYFRGKINQSSGWQMRVYSHPENLLSAPG
jgi:FdhD protein